MESTRRWARYTRFGLNLLVLGAFAGACGEPADRGAREHDGGATDDAGGPDDDASIGDEPFQVVRTEGVPAAAYAEFQSEILPEAERALRFWASAGLPVADARLVLGPDSLEPKQTAADLGAMFDVEFPRRVKELALLAASDPERAYASLRTELAPEYYLLATTELGPGQLPPTLAGFMQLVAEDERTYTDLSGLLEDLVNGELDYRPYLETASALPRFGPERNGALPRGYILLGGPSFHDEEGKQPRMGARYLDAHVVIHEFGHLAQFQLPEAEALLSVAALGDYRLGCMAPFAEISADLFVHLHDLELEHAHMIDEEGREGPVRSYAQPDRPVALDAFAEFAAHDQATMLGHALLTYARSHREQHTELAAAFARGQARATQRVGERLGALPELPDALFYTYYLEQQALGVSLLVRYVAVLLDAMIEAVPSLATELDAVEVLGVTAEEVDWLEQRVLELPGFRVGESITGDQGSELEIREDGIFIDGRGPFMQTSASVDGVSHVSEVTLPWQLWDDELGTSEELRVGLNGTWVLSRDGAELERFDATGTAP